MNELTVAAALTGKEANNNSVTFLIQQVLQLLIILLQLHAHAEPRFCINKVSVGVLVAIRRLVPTSVF